MYTTSQQSSSSCQVCFIDCMGYYDMVSQIISILILIIVIAKSYINTYNLFTLTKHTSHSIDEELIKSHKRKLIVNIISFVYQFSLLATVTFSLLLFLTYINDIKQAGYDKVNLWYKWSEIIFINLLNCLTLTVGLLYWKGVRLYYKLSQQHIPVIYSRWVKIIFAIVYLMNFAIIIVSLIMLLDTEQTHYEQYEIKIINIVNAIGVGCSTIVCLANRFLYQHKILNNMSMNKSALRKQNLYSFLIAFSGCCRLACTLINLLGIDYAQLTRNFNEDCLDSTPYHAILMSLVTILIDIMPAVIVIMIFAPMISSQHKSYHEINHYLAGDNKNNQSVRYV